MGKVSGSAWISFRSLVLLLACSVVNSRLSRKNFILTGKQGQREEGRGKGNKSIFNLLRLFGGNESEQDNNYDPFVNDDKRLAILSNQRSISRDELVENVIKAVISVIGTVFYYRVISQLGDSFRSMGSSVMGVLKTDLKSGDFSSLHPNVTKMLQANTTLNSYEIEILQVDWYSYC